MATGRLLRGDGVDGRKLLLENIEDYYLTPWELGYGPHVKFDHDFVGREALEQRPEDPQRRKVTLALNTADVMRAIGSEFEKDDRAKYMEFPSAVYSMSRTTRSRRTARRSASRRGLATARTKARC